MENELFRFVNSCKEGYSFFTQHDDHPSSYIYLSLYKMIRRAFESYLTSGLTDFYIESTFIHKVHEDTERLREMYLAAK